MKPSLSTLVPVALMAALAACSPPAQKTGPTASASASALAAPSVAGLPAGVYHSDPTHTSLTFEVSHMGFSHYTARFASIDAQMQFDPAHPDQAQLTAMIDPQSLQLNAPPKGFHDTLMGKGWFEAGQFPDIRFISTNIAMTGPDTADVTGNLSLHGVTKPVVLHVRFNGGYPGMAVYDPHARLGFSATGQLKRSDFGISFGIPQPGSSLGVGDTVDFQIESEFTGPALASAQDTASS
ncbi:YceI family protein [Asticcacaulis sp. EMRT-3]|uniref:YceI family protein n=1 Tax=Asticcacaulis sp. EMRT-3 TaxID=3040349 RepID=UPI0024AFC907|nr:YceI family protein [Asticcacaulis sp. EMRT-3]MDI7775555.1 YceI family protein [Asticcacaulis sp. EMRT-3]